MLWHCGLLDDDPTQSRTLKWIKATTWGSLPPEIERELRVWLAMPGMVAKYHAYTLNTSIDLINKNIGGYEQHKDDVIANWLSATREDCVRISQIRPPKGCVPLISQIKAVEDLKTMRLVDVARDYRATPQSIMGWRRRGFRFLGQLPSGFQWLVNPN